MRNNKPLIVTIIILVILNITTLTFLWLGRPLHRNERLERPNVERYLHRKLNLSHSQQQNFQLARAEHFEKTSRLMDVIGKTRHELSKTESDNHQKIDSLLESISQNNKDLERLNFKHFKKLKSFCDDVQKPQFDSIMNEMMRNDRHRKRH
jgi:hypothetical protein